MKKNYILFLIATTTLSLSVSAQKTAAPAMTKASAGKIIDMTNSVVDIYNDQLSEVKDVRECLERFENTMNTVAANPQLTAHGASCNNIRVLRTDLVDKMQKKAALAPAFPEKKDIIDGINALNKEFEISKVRCQNVQKYFTSKKYKEDDKNYSTYTALRDSFIETYQNINYQLAKTMDLASTAGDKAEIVILKTHPLASVVIPMKTDLSEISSMMSKCRGENPDAETIKSSIATIRKKIEKDKVMTPAMKASLAKANNGESLFNRFYEYADMVLENADTYVEYLDPKKEVKIDHVLQESEADARNRYLKRYYDEMRRYRELMVDSYNTL